MFGDTLHPGGLGLTNRLSRMMDIQPGQWIADLASGGGASAQAVSRVFRCNVIGVEFGALSVAKAINTSHGVRGGGRAFFVQGDAEYIPFRPGRFDGVLCECSMSLFSNKSAVVEQAVQLLKPDGTFGLSDVTLTPGTLPRELEGALGQLLCLPDALDVQGYADLLTNGGLGRCTSIRRFARSSRNHRQCGIQAECIPGLADHFAPRGYGVRLPGASSPCDANTAPDGGARRLGVLAVRRAETWRRQIAFRPPPYWNWL